MGGDHFAQRGAVGQIPGELDGIDQAAGVFQIVGIVLGADGAVVVAAPDLFGRGDAAAVAGGVVALGEGAAAGTDYAAGGVYGLDHPRVVGIEALEHLIGGGVGHVPVSAAGGVLALHDVGARGHGLGLQRLEGEGIAHLVGHHAAEVFLHVGGQDQPQRAVLHFGAQVAVVEVGAVGLGEDQAVGRLVGGVAGEGDAPAHVDDQSAGAEPDLIADGVQRDLRAPGEPEAGVVFHGVLAVDGHMERVDRSEGLQQHADLAVVVDGGRFGQRQRQRHDERQQQRRQFFYGKKHGYLLMRAANPGFVRQG